MSSAFSSLFSKNSPPAEHKEDVQATYLPMRQTTAWQRARNHIREPMAEFLGTMVFVMFGTGVDCQTVLSSSPSVSSGPKGDWLSVSVGWGIGLALGGWISGGISGGHLNPAVTLGMATWRRFPWKKVPFFILAQLLGALVGSAIVYGNYKNAIDLFEAGDKTRATAGLFATYALDYMSAATAFFTEFLGTAILAFVVLAATDGGNNATPKGLFPITLFLLLMGLATAFGMQTSFGFNPARDFGPRLMLTMAGYGKQLYLYRSQYWLWCPIIAPFVGAQVGMGIYDLFLYNPEPARIEMERKNSERTLGANEIV